MPSWHIKSKSFLIQLFLPCGNPSCLFILQLSILCVHNDPLLRVEYSGKESLLVCSLNVVSHAVTDTAFWVYAELTENNGKNWNSKLVRFWNEFFSCSDLFFFNCMSKPKLLLEKIWCHLWYHLEMLQKVVTSCSKAKEKQVIFCLWLSAYMKHLNWEVQSTWQILRSHDPAVWHSHLEDGFSLL